jgi:hypothetical protein
MSTLIDYFNFEKKNHLHVNRKKTFFMRKKNANHIDHSRLHIV